jgi:hypothetical protein
MVKGIVLSMKRTEQLKHNQKIINKISRVLIPKRRIPSYKIVCRYLNNRNLISSTGNKWTERSLYRMLQRSGFSGLWGLSKVT